MLKLYDYGRSSASYRVRIGLNLKGVCYDSIPVNILPGKDEQFAPENRARNAAARVPFVETEAGVLAQSLAILDWLEDEHPTPQFLPSDPWLRAQVRSFAYAIACDIHPLNNLSVLARLRLEFSANEDHIANWYMHWIGVGFHALEAQLRGRPETAFAFGDDPSLADICLVPQMANARRYPLDLSHFPRLVAIDARACQHPAFAKAAPENQKPASA
jgi:maleylpyruvate isomerase